MVSHHFVYQLVLFAFLWLFIIVYLLQPKRPVAASEAPADPKPMKPKHHRSDEPQPAAAVIAAAIAIVTAAAEQQDQQEDDQKQRHRRLFS